MKSHQSSRSSVSPFHWAAGLILCLALGDFAAGAVAAGSLPKDWPANPANHRITVSREATDQKQAAMIAAAEAAQPSKEALSKALEAGERNGAPASDPPKQALPPAGEKVWWYKEALGIRIPCAITADAVAYYSDLVEKYGKLDFKRYAQPSSRLDYHATVAAHQKFEHQGQKFEDVHVVTLKLDFSQNFAATQTEGMHFQKERVVILDAKGKVLHITGDGPTEVPILAM